MTSITFPQLLHPYHIRVFFNLFAAAEPEGHLRNPVRIDPWVQQH